MLRMFAGLQSDLHRFMFEYDHYRFENTHPIGFGYTEYQIHHTGHPVVPRPQRTPTPSPSQPLKDTNEPNTPVLTDEEQEYEDMARSWYNPKVYTCYCYDYGPEQYFDGKAGPRSNSRFTIDLEGGTMDRYVTYQLFNLC
jgi:hypothetical protein